MTNNLQLQFSFNKKVSQIPEIAPKQPSSSNYPYFIRNLYEPKTDVNLYEPITGAKQGMDINAISS